MEVTVVRNPVLSWFALQQHPKKKKRHMDSLDRERERERKAMRERQRRCPTSGHALGQVSAHPKVIPPGNNRTPARSQFRFSNQGLP